MITKKIIAKILIWPALVGVILIAVSFGMAFFVSQNPEKVEQWVEKRIESNVEQQEEKREPKNPIPYAIGLALTFPILVYIYKLINKTGGKNE